MKRLLYRGTGNRKQT